MGDTSTSILGGGGDVVAISIKVKCLVRDEGPSHPGGGPILTQEGTRIINIVKQLITDVKI